jgi:hypothetical protein
MCHDLEGCRFALDKTPKSTSCVVRRHCRETMLSRPESLWRRLTLGPALGHKLGPDALIRTFHFFTNALTVPLVYTRPPMYTTSPSPILSPFYLDHSHGRAERHGGGDKCGVAVVLRHGSRNVHSRRRNWSQIFHFPFRPRFPVVLRRSNILRLPFTILIPFPSFSSKKIHRDPSTPAQPN